MHDGQQARRRLAEAAGAGDRGAVAALLEAHLPELQAFVRLRAGPLVRAHESCADIVQSVCREVLEGADRFRHPGDEGFRRWLFRTALRKLSDRRDYWRSAKREHGRAVPLPGAGEEDDAGASRLLDAYSRFTRPSHRAEVRDEIRRIEAAFAELREDEQEVIALAHLAGLSRAEIAEQMGRSEGAVRVLLHRALARLVDRLATGAAPPDPA